MINEHFSKQSTRLQISIRKVVFDRRLWTTCTTIVRVGSGVHVVITCSRCKALGQTYTKVVDQTNAKLQSYCAYPQPSLNYSPAVQSSLPIIYLSTEVPLLINSLQNKEQAYVSNQSQNLFNRSRKKNSVDTAAIDHNLSKYYATVFFPVIVKFASHSLSTFNCPVVFGHIRHCPKSLQLCIFACQMQIKAKYLFTLLSFFF